MAIGTEYTYNSAYHQETVMHYGQFTTVQGSNKPENISTVLLSANTIYTLSSVDTFNVVEIINNTTSSKLYFDFTNTLTSVSALSSKGLYITGINYYSVPLNTNSIILLSDTNSTDIRCVVWH